jgi:hypothetical protein
MPRVLMVLSIASGRRHMESKDTKEVLHLFKDSPDNVI